MDSIAKKVNGACLELAPLPSLAENFSRYIPAAFHNLPVKPGLCYLVAMSATELIREIQRLPEAEREQVFEFVLRAQKPHWATPRPLGFFAGCYTNDEIEESNWFAARGPKAIVP